MSNNLLNNPIIQQLAKTKNPKAAIQNLLKNNPTYNSMQQSFDGKSNEQRAQMICDYCNNNGISKEQLEGLFNLFK